MGNPLSYSTLCPLSPPHPGVSPDRRSIGSIQVWCGDGTLAETNKSFHIWPQPAQIWPHTLHPWLLKALQHLLSSAEFSFIFNKAPDWWFWLPEIPRKSAISSREISDSSIKTLKNWGDATAECQRWQEEELRHTRHSVLSRGTLKCFSWWKGVALFNTWRRWTGRHFLLCYICCSFFSLFKSWRCWTSRRDQEWFKLNFKPHQGHCIDCQTLLSTIWRLLQMFSPLQFVPSRTFFTIIYSACSCAPIIGFAPLTMCIIQWAEQCSLSRV